MSLGDPTRVSRSLLYRAACGCILYTCINGERVFCFSFPAETGKQTGRRRAVAVASHPFPIGFILATRSLFLALAHSGAQLPTSSTSSSGGLNPCLGALLTSVRSLPCLRQQPSGASLKVLNPIPLSRFFYTFGSSLSRAY